MGIPEAQLDTWSSIGAQATSRDTYATIKTCLDAGHYGGKNFCSFLQGSYGNDTNIFKESDVDVVMELTGIFYYDLDALSEPQRTAWRSNHPDAEYTLAEFKTDVHAALRAKFGTDVELGTKAITVKARDPRRKADVLPCAEFRKVVSYGGLSGEQYVKGICFYKSDGTRVVNYPRLHSQHLTTRHGETNSYFKPVIRIFKNARQKLINDGVIATGVAPSYYIEGLLYNVPKTNFGTNYATSVFNALKYLCEADRSQFVCANEQYRLLDGNADVTWTSANCTAFLNAFVDMWNQW